MALSLLATQVTFTEVWTTHTKQFYVNPYWTITQFLESMRPLIKNEFKTNNYEIVEAGQHIRGISAEDAPAITNSNILMRNKWGYDLRVSFYIRRKNFDYSNLRQSSINKNILALEHINSSLNPIIINYPILEECPICLETIQFINNMNNFGCTHNICNKCYVNCKMLNHTKCPICRHEFKKENQL